jgi:protein TonB
MFDQIVSDSSARTRPLALALSLAGQLSLVGLAVLVPLLLTESLTEAAGPGRLLRLVAAPLPRGDWKAAVQRQTAVRAAGKPAPHGFTEPAFREPANVPAGVLLADDAPGVSALSAEAASYDASDGVPGALPAEVMPPPKVAAPKPAQPPQAPPAIVRLKVGGIVQAAKILNQVTPAYPPLARQARIAGVVRLEAVIGRNGRISSLQVTSGHPLLVQAALEAVRQWVYLPTLLNGEPVEILTQIEVHFKLGE